MPFQRGSTSRTYPTLIKRSRWASGTVTCLGLSANCFNTANSSLVSRSLCRVNDRVWTRRVLIARILILDLEVALFPAHSMMPRFKGWRQSSSCNFFCQGNVACRVGNCPRGLKYCYSASAADALVQDLTRQNRPTCSGGEGTLCVDSQQVVTICDVVFQ